MKILVNIQFPVTTITENYSININDCIILCNTSSSQITVTLPDAINIKGKKYAIKNIGTNNLIINTSLSQTIDGGSSKTITVQYDSIEVVSDGSNWFII